MALLVYGGVCVHFLACVSINYEINISLDCRILLASVLLNSYSCFIILHYAVCTLYPSVKLCHLDDYVMMFR
jgi:hypothetical protein